MQLAERLTLDLTALGFVLLGAATALEWYRHRGKAEARLALSLVFLAIVAALGRIQAMFGQSAAIAIVTVIAFMASGYFVLLFRDAFVPLSRRARQAATALLAGSCVVGVAAVTVLAIQGAELMDATPMRA